MALSTDPALLVAEIAADPPPVHEGAPDSVWRTEAGCYELIASRIGPASRTLETGCGISTAVFAARGAQHVCVMPFVNEADAVRAWCDRYDVAAGSLSFEIGPSDAVLPAMEPTPLDLIFIDGDHRFPSPVIDWYYTIKRLVPGGLVVLDDVQLPGPRLLADFIESLPPFGLVERTPKWAAFALESEPTPPESWPLPKAQEVLIPGGRLEQLGRRIDAKLAKLKRRRSAG